MSEEILNIQLILVSHLIGVLAMLLVLLVYPKMKKSQPKKTVGDKIILMFVITVVGILTALLAISYYFEMSPLDETGDVSNWATLVIEIGIGTAIGSSIFLYSSVQQKKSDEELSDVKKISTKLDGMMEDVKKTNDEQSQMIKEMKPIIEKQGRIIKKQEEKERIVIDNLFNHIRFELFSSKHALSKINELAMKNDSYQVLPGGLEREIMTLETSNQQIIENRNKLFSLEKMVPQKIGDAQAEIHIYTTKLLKRELQADEEGRLIPVPDPVKVIEKIDIALKELPEPGPA